MINKWWYYTPQTGQHISFYSKKTLEYISKKYNRYLISNNIDTHILSRHKICSKFFFFLKVYNKINRIILSKFFKKKSRTWDDHILIANKAQSGT
jgi:hypothetical protein